MMEKIKKHLVLSSMLLSLILGVLIAGVSMLFTTVLRYENDVWDARCLNICLNYKIKKEQQ